jgi:hypothetical protein
MVEQQVAEQPDLTAAVPVKPEPRPRGPGGRFKPGNEDAFNKAVEDFAAQAESSAVERRDGLLALGAPAKKEVQPEEASEDAPAGKPETPKVESAAVKAAKEALKRAKVPQSRLDEIKGEEDLAQWQGIIELVKAGDSASRELGELRKGTKESALAEKESAPAEQPFDIDAVLKPLEPVLDEDAGKAVSKAFKDLKAHYDRELQSVKDQLKGVLPEVKQSQTDRLKKIYEETAAELKERFPQLGDKAYLYGEFLPAMTFVNRKGEDGKHPYTDPVEAMTRTAEYLKLPEKTPAAPAPQPLRPAKRPASPITDTRKAAARPLTWSDKADIALAELDKGKTVEDVRTLLRR